VALRCLPFITLGVALTVACYGVGFACSGFFGGAAFFSSFLSSGLAAGCLGATAAGFLSAAGFPELSLS